MAINYKKWNILLVTTCSNMLIYLDVTAIPIAIPYLEKQFSLSVIDGMWVINAYLLALLSFCFIAGKLSENYGKKRVFITGFALFGLGSVLSALSMTGWWIITSRIIQGIGGALSFPTLTAILLDNFPANERSRALGLNTGISSIFLLAGPGIGGYFIEYLDWRYIFWVNVPIVIYGIVIGTWIIPQSKVEKKKFHFEGALLIMSALIAFVILLMEGSQWGWFSWPIGILLLVSLTSFFFFIRTTKRVEHPLIDLALFKSRPFNRVNICIFLSQAILTFTIFLAIYFQKQMGYSPVETGKIILYGSIPVVVCSPLGGYLSDHFSPKIPIAIGFGLLLVSFGLLLFFTHTKFDIILDLLVFSCGVAIVRAPAFASAISYVSEGHLAGAISFIKTSKQFAVTFGLAVMTAIVHAFNEKYHSYQQSYYFIILLFILFSLMSLISFFYANGKDAARR